MDKNWMKEKSYPLSAFARKEWFSAPDKSSFWLRAYKCFYVGEDESKERFRSAIRLIEYRLPVAITYVWTKEFELDRPRHSLSADKDGWTRVELSLEKIKMPSSLYVFLATPCSIDGAPSNFEKIHNAYRTVIGILQAYVGYNLLREKVFDREVLAHDGSTPFTEASKIEKLPQPGDGPFSLDIVWEGVAKTIDALKATNEDKRRCIELSLDYLSRGLEQDHGFVDHWTACEILCEGKRAPEMRRRLQKHYSLRERGDVDRLFGFKTLERWRHELFHRGIYPKFKPEVGRYMQMMFLDLLRHELNLGGPGYMQIFLRSPGYDLSELGIAKADEVIKE
jgi:hypothetical protein